MVDHGNQSGIEHFVKILLWAGWDSNGKRVIKNFCLNVDKSNHAVKDYASAIKISVKNLNIAGLDMTNIRFHELLVIQVAAVLSSMFILISKQTN